MLAVYWGGALRAAGWATETTTRLNNDFASAQRRGARPLDLYRCDAKRGSLPRRLAVMSISTREWKRLFQQKQNQN